MLVGEPLAAQVGYFPTADPDLDSLAVQVTGLPLGLEPVKMQVTHDEGVAIVGTPLRGGVFPIEVCVREYYDTTAGEPNPRPWAWVCAPWLLTVINEPPRLEVVLVDQVTIAGYPASYTISGSDPEQHYPLSYVGGPLPPGLQLETVGNLTGVFSGIPTVPGTYPIIVTVEDRYKGSVTGEFTWTVTNRDPRLAIPNQTNVEGFALPQPVQLAAVDDDGHAVTYEEEAGFALPPGLVLNPQTGLITGTPTTAGVYQVRITARDGYGGRATAAFTWTITNLPPTFEVPDRTNTVAFPLTVTISASDPDGHTPLAYAASGLPAGLQIHPTSGVISGSPTTVGTVSPSITVTDSRGLATTKSFTWTITNLAPIFEAPNRTNTVGFPITGASIAGSDPDGHTPLTYAASGLPAGLSIHPATGVFSGTPTTVGTVESSVTVTDSQGLATTKPFTWTITNLAPTFEAPNRTNTVGFPITGASIAGSDPDGHTPVTYAASGLPDGLSIHPATGVFSGTPTTVGTVQSSVTVTDSQGLATTKSFTWTITNMPPVFAVTDQSTRVNTAVTLTIVARDPDGHTPMTGLVEDLPTGLVASYVLVSGDLHIVISGTPTEVGASTVEVSVTDGMGLTTEKTFTWTIFTDPVNVGQFRTQTQGGWGSTPSGTNPGAFLATHFGQVYGSAGVRIGNTGTSRTLTFTSAAAIDRFLPASGRAGVLSGSAVDPAQSSAGVFAGQVLALRISVDFSRAGVTPKGLGALKVVSGKLTGYTVDQVLALANSVLGGGPLPLGITLSDLNSTVDKINNNFVDGTKNAGYLR